MADVTFEKLGGLNLVADPQEAGAEQAISCLNFTLDRNGRGRTRDGYDVLYDSGVDATVTNLHQVSAGIVLAACLASNVRAIDLGTGTSIANVALASGASSFASAGSAVYFTDTSAAQIRKYTGGAFSSPAGLASYEGNYLAVQPLEDRLVIADANNTSRLWFSNPATPETITYSAGPPETGDFIELTPGDGEPITGMAVYGTELFVFKRSKFFVFYGNSIDETGGSIFNYRMVDTGVGCDHVGIHSIRLVATHETGVYFLGYDGVYRTTGGPPVKVSGLIDPAFKGANLPIPGPFSTVLANPVSSWLNLSVARDELYVIGSTGSTAIQFVMNLTTGEWMVYDLPAACALDGVTVADATDTGSYRGSVIFGGVSLADSDGIVFKGSRAYTDDDGTPIGWHHQSGFYDLGSQNTKRLRRSVLWGTGTPTVSIFTDHGTTDGNAAAVTLGTAPAVARGWHTKAYRGVLFSHRLSGSSPATVHRIGHQVPDERLGR